MTRKHFAALAAEVARIEDYVARNLAADAVAKACAKFNPAFDRAKFLEAARIPPAYPAERVP